MTNATAIRFLPGMLRSHSHRMLVLLVVTILGAILLPFFLWGEKFNSELSLLGAQRWMSVFGQWSWLAGIIILMSDIILPIPSTIVMSALGWGYGWFLGGLLSSVGSFLAGLIAYIVCRRYGQAAARWLVDDDGLAQGTILFAKQGGWLVATSRWLPVLPEAISCLAGLFKMNPTTYLLALACGCLPAGYAFAAIGAMGSSNPEFALLLSGALPLFLWIGSRALIRKATSKKSCKSDYQSGAKKEDAS